MRALRLLLPVLLLVAVVATPAAHAAKVRVVATGLDSPRHLAFGSKGDLFVAESGRGGSGPCFAGPEGGPACVGATGAVTRISRTGRQSHWVTGLASFANSPSNTDAIGPHGIAVRGAHDVLVTNGGPTEPADAKGNPISRDTLAAQDPVADLFGRLLRVPRLGSVRRIADVWGFERASNPDAKLGNPAVDSNVVDVLPLRRGYVIADAGGNAIHTVSRSGKLSALTIFANRTVPNPMGGGNVPMQAVPTSVVRGPKGNYYVGQLTGFPFPPGGANVYRVNPRTGKARVFASGFTNVMDLAFGPRRTLYVLEIDANGLLNQGDEGAIFAVDRKGRKRQIALPAGALPAPGGIAVRRGALYVTTNAGSPGTGRVVRIK
jgi:hypothetical protein